MIITLEVIHVSTRFGDDKTDFSFLIMKHEVPGSQFKDVKKRFFECQICFDDKVLRQLFGDGETESLNRHKKKTY